MSLIGNLKEMSAEYLRAAVFEKYGVTLFVGVGIPIPILDEEMVHYAAIKDSGIHTCLLDYGIQSRDRPTVAKVTYEELKSGEIVVNGKKIPTAPVSSLYKAREIASQLKNWVARGEFELNAPVQMLPKDKQVNPLNLKEDE